MKYERAIKAIHVHPVISRLTEARLAWGIDRADMAARIGCAVCCLQGWENGEHAPRIDALSKWADALGYNLNLWPKGKT